MSKNISFQKKFNYRNFFRTASKKFPAGFLEKLPRFPKFSCKRNFFTARKFILKKSCFFLGLCRSFFRKIGKNVLVRCSKPQFNFPEVHDSWKNLALGKLLIFSQIRIWSKSCMKVLWQPSDNLDKIAIQVSTETFWTKSVLFLIKTIFFLFTDIYWCNFEHSNKTTLSVLSIRHSTYPGERLDEISYLQRIRIVLPFADFEKKISSTAAGNFVTVVEMVLRCPKYVFWLICSTENCAFLCLFRILSDSASFLADFCSAGFAKLHSMWQTIFSRKNFWVENFSFNSSNVSGFYRKTLGLMAITVHQPCQKCTFSTSETNWGNNCLEKLYRLLTNFGL